MDNKEPNIWQGEERLRDEIPEKYKDYLIKLVLTEHNGAFGMVVTDYPGIRIMDFGSARDDNPGLFGCTTWEAALLTKEQVIWLRNFLDKTLDHFTPVYKPNIDG